MYAGLLHSFVDSPPAPCYILMGVRMNSSSNAKRTRKLLISREQIAETIKRMANQIQEDYPADMPLLVGVLKGSFIFLADLVRQMQRPVEIDFIRLSSYGSDVKSSGSVRLRMGVSSLVKGKEILVVEDIVDTGLTTAYASGYLRRKGASSVKLCTLLDKPSRRQMPVTPDYLGFTVPNEFIVGYGLDFDQQYRHLPDIHVLESGTHES